MIELLFQNNEFIAVEKPYGLSVHNDDETGNLLELLQAQLKIEKLYPVHRLDKETSGIQVLALTQEAAKKLSDEFQNKSVKKIYIGILKGQLKENAGVWKKALTNKAEGRKNPAGISQNRVPCETQFRVLKSTSLYTYCEFNLITGRRHQIRKHAALAQHELIGDAVYGVAKYNKKIADVLQAERMYLHCSQLEILGQKIVSPMPPSFTHLLNNL